MGNEKNLLKARRPKPLIVERGNPRLAGPCRSHDQVPKMSPLPLSAQCLEDFELKGLGLDVNTEAVRSWRDAWTVLRIECRLEARAVNMRVVVLKLRFIPV